MNKVDIELQDLARLLKRQRTQAGELLQAIQDGKLHRLATFAGQDAEIWRLIGRVDVLKEGDRQ